jgi:hypothetical protein
MTTKDIDECLVSREIPCLLAAIPFVPDIQKGPAERDDSESAPKGIAERQNRNEFA